MSASDGEDADEAPLPAGPTPPFIALEDTRRLAVEAAHRTIAQLAGLPSLSEAGARQLRVLVGVINDAEELEIRRFVVMGKVGDKAPAEPDVEGARRIAEGQGRGQ
jgi:hypothetical protein